MNVPRRSEGVTAPAAATAPAPIAPAPASHSGNGRSGGAGVSAGETLIKKEEEEEETLGQLRDRLVLASARAAVPGPRAAFVHIKVEDTTSGEDTDGEGGGGDRGEATSGEGDGEEAEEEEDREEDEREEQEGQLRELEVQAPDARFKGLKEAGADALTPPRRARLPPGSYADTAVELDTDDDYEQEEEEEVEEEEGVEEDEAVPRDRRAHAPGASLAMGGGDAVRLRILSKGARSEPGSPQARLRAPGRVSVINTVQEPEEEDEEAGIAPVIRKRGGSGAVGSSWFTGVCWNKRSNKWQAECKGKHLGYHTTEEAAARAYNKYLKDGVVPEPTAPGPAGASQFKGVSWHTGSNKWKAQCKRTHLGLHATQEDAARACSKFLEDGIHPVAHREASTSRFTGVGWNTRKNKWQTRCRGKFLGNHLAEGEAARAYNVEAARVGLALNVIPPAGAAGVGVDTDAGAGGDASPGGTGAGPNCAGHKRVAPKTSQFKGVCWDKEKYKW